MKFTLINFIIGVAIAVILSVLLVLGLRIFIPAPQYPVYDYPVSKCISGDESCFTEQQRDHSQTQEKYQVEYKSYSGKIFIASNILGLIILIAGLVVFGFNLGTNIAAGIIVSGAFGIIFGYIVGWVGADDKVKFLVGIVVAALVIAGGVMINRMRKNVV